MFELFSEHPEYGTWVSVHSVDNPSQEPYLSNFLRQLDAMCAGLFPSFVRYNLKISEGIILVKLAEKHSKIVNC